MTIINALVNLNLFFFFPQRNIEAAKGVSSKAEGTSRKKKAPQKCRQFPSDTTLLPLKLEKQFLGDSKAEEELEQCIKAEPNEEEFLDCSFASK